MPNWLDKFYSFALEQLVKIIPNKDQALGLLKTAIANSGWLYAFLNDNLSGSQRDMAVNMITIFGPVAVVAVWNLVDRTIKNQIAKVNHIDDVQKVIMAPNATGGAAAAVDDSNLKKVVSAADFAVEKK